MNSAIVAALLGLLTFVPGFDDEKLEGTWLCVRAERDGQSAEEQVGGKIVLADGKITITHAKREEVNKGTYKVDNTKSPKHITLIPDAGEGAEAKEFVGVYEIKGDELKICLGGPGAERPTDLTTSADSMRMLMVFKRDKGADK